MRSHTQIVTLTYLQEVERYRMSDDSDSGTVTAKRRRKSKVCRLISSYEVRQLKIT